MGMYVILRILNRRHLGNKLTENALNLPKLRSLNEHSNTNVIVGDDSFALTENLFRPYGGLHLNKNKWVFNYQSTRARRYIECVFGILSNKLRIFHWPLDVNLETAICVVKACIVLHRFFRQKGGFDFESTRIKQEINYFPNISNGHLIGRCT